MTRLYHYHYQLHPDHPVSKIAASCQEMTTIIKCKRTAYIYIYIYIYIINLCIIHIAKIKKMQDDYIYTYIYIYVQ